MWAFSPCGAISLAARLRATSAGSTCQQDITFAALNKSAAEKTFPAKGTGLKAQIFFWLFPARLKPCPDTKLSSHADSKARA
jgi:hypothetical protein